jgi:hypothetical protein
MTDTLLDRLFGQPSAAPRRDVGPAAMVRDLWLGGMPPSRAAEADHSRRARSRLGVFDPASSL